MSSKWEEPSAMTMAEWDDWKRRMKAAHPIRYWWTQDVQVCSFWWWFGHRLRPAHRYHVIRTGLAPGYYDPDTQILHGVMTLIDKFATSTAETVNWQSDPSHAAAWHTISAAQNWWRCAKSQIHDLASYDDEQYWEQGATVHLLSLMLVRRHLWYP